MEVHQNARRIRAWRDRPLALDAAAINGVTFDVFCRWPKRADLVEARPPLGPANRARLRVEHRPDTLDFAVVHRCGPRQAAVPTVSACCSAANYSGPSLAVGPARKRL